MCCRYHVPLPSIGIRRTRLKKKILKMRPAPAAPRKMHRTPFRARIDTDEPLAIAATRDGAFILIDVPSCKGWGYSEETLSGGKK